MMNVETLNTCFVYTINWGMRSGGGLGDVLEETYLQDIEAKPVKTTPSYTGTPELSSI